MCARHVGKTANERFRVLIVDDDHQDAFFVESALQQAGVDEIDIATSGAQALKIIREKRHELVILDLNLPGVTGRDVLRELKSGEERISVPIIILSASAQRIDIDECYALHANAYLVKPYDIETYDEIAQRLAEFWRDAARLPRPIAAE